MDDHYTGQGHPRVSEQHKLHSMALQQRKWKAKWVGKRGRAGKNYDQNALRGIQGINSYISKAKTNKKNSNDLRMKYVKHKLAELCPERSLKSPCEN